MRIRKIQDLPIDEDITVTGDDLHKVFGELVERHALADRIMEWVYEKFRVVTTMAGAGLWEVIEVTPVGMEHSER